MTVASPWFFLIGAIPAVKEPCFLQNVASSLVDVPPVKASATSWHISGRNLGGTNAIDQRSAPDNGITGLRDVVDHARHMAARADIPIMIDTDTGYGNAVNVHFAAQEMVRSGVAALSLEDQEAPKKSSTLAGRRVISQSKGSQVNSMGG
jgi:Phosphoenolpyruvate phosphomutase